MAFVKFLFLITPKSAPLLSQSSRYFAFLLRFLLLKRSWGPYTYYWSQFANYPSLPHFLVAWPGIQKCCGERDLRDFLNLQSANLILSFWDQSASPPHYFYLIGSQLGQHAAQKLNGRCCRIVSYPDRSISIKGILLRIVRLLFGYDCDVSNYGCFPHYSHYHWCYFWQK